MNCFFSFKLRIKLGEYHRPHQSGACSPKIFSKCPDYLNFFRQNLYIFSALLLSQQSHPSNMDCSINFMYSVTEPSPDLNFSHSIKFLKALQHFVPIASNALSHKPASAYTKALEIFSD